MKVRRFIASSIACLALLGVTAGTASAEYGTQPGYPVANGNTPCADAGSFGAFGDKGDVAHDLGINNLGSNGKPGADGAKTGYNNSHNCGSPQN